MINCKALGLAGAIVWSLLIFLSLLGNIYLSYAPLLAELIMQIYPGVALNLLGSFIGLAWGFADGFIALFLIGWLYNTLARRK